MVKKKGPDPYAIAAVGKEIANSGLNRGIIKSHQEPAIRQLVEAVKNERAEEINIAKNADDSGKVSSG